MATFFQRPDSLPVGTFNEDPRGPTKTKTTMNELREDGLPTWMNCIDTTGKPISYCRRLMVETKQMFNESGRKMQNEEGIYFSVGMVEKERPASYLSETEYGGSASSDSDSVSSAHSRGSRFHVSSDRSSALRRAAGASPNRMLTAVPSIQSEPPKNDYSTPKCCVGKQDTEPSVTHTIADLETDLSSWEVMLKSEHIGLESSLGRDLKRNNIPGVVLEMTVPHNYPMEPPFVRVKYPKLEGGYIFPHGAICFEPLTPKGWPQSMTLMHIAISLKAMFNSRQNVRVASVGDLKTGKIDAYSREGAMKDHKKILAVHKGGDKWYRPKMKS